MTKPGAPAATPVLLERARRRFALPIVAIGGVTLHNAPQLIGSGADLVAVVAGSSPPSRQPKWSAERAASVNCFIPP